MKAPRFFNLKGTRWLLVSVALAVLIFGFRAFRSVPAPSTILEARDAIETVLASGRVVGEKSVPLSFIRPGLIAREFIRDGEAVPAGHVLARQDARREELALAQARISLSEARLRKEKLLTADIPDAEEKVRQAKAHDVYAADYLKRQSELFEQKAVTLLHLEQARRDRELTASILAATENQLRSLRDVQTAQADLAVARAESELNKAEIEARDTILTAPGAGRIVSHDAHPGEYVQSGQRVVTFIPDAPLTIIEIQVDETNAGRLAPGQKAAVSSAAFPGRVFYGEVERLGAIVDPRRGSFTVRLALDRFEADLLPESSVSVQVEIARISGALLLQQRFILQENGQAWVYVVEGRRAKRIPVVVRDLGDGLFECREGLSRDQTILLPQGLKDGLRVKLVPLPE